MHAPRSLTPLSRRLGAGIAAAAVVTAGLACLGTAHAAELADFPQELDFTPTDLAASAEEVYAAGYVGVGTSDTTPFATVDGYVEAVGSGEKVHLGDGTWPSAISVSPDGQTLHVVGTRTDEAFPDNGTSAHRWTIATGTMTVTASESLGIGNVYDVATDASGTYITTSLDDNASVLRLGSALVPVGPAISPSHIGLLPDGESTDVVVAGADFVEDGSEASLRIISDGEVGEKVVLGPVGGSDDSVIGMDVDEVNGLVYLTSFRDVVEGPQEYGLNVIGPDTERYIPIDHPVSSVVVSPDGETVYVAGSGVSAYDVDELDSYSEDDPAPAAYFGDQGFVGLATSDPGGRLYATTEETTYDPETDELLGSVLRVHALEAPGTPTGLQAVTPEWGDGSMLLSWTAPASTGGANAYSLTYRLSLQDQAGGEPITVDDVFGTDHEFTGLVAGRTYSVSVTATNGAFTGTAASTTYTAPAALAVPSAVAVSGKVAVGSRLSVATTGTWPTGTVLAYEWRNGAGSVLGRSSTLTLSPAQVGRRVRVAVTGTLPGFAPGTVTSLESAQVALGTLVSRTPKVTGTAKVGRTLTAVPGSWTSGTRLTYRWTADGKTIARATARTFKPTKAVRGKRIRVVVTGTKTGYRTVARTSGATAKVAR
jgi:hypothetical protein